MIARGLFFIAHPKTSRDVGGRATCRIHTYQTLDSDWSRPVYKSHREVSAAKPFPEQPTSKPHQAGRAKTGLRLNALTGAPLADRDQLPRRPCRGRAHRGRAVAEWCLPYRFAARQSESDRACLASRQTGPVDCRGRIHRRKKLLGLIGFWTKWLRWSSPLFERERLQVVVISLVPVADRLLWAS